MSKLIVSKRPRRPIDNATLELNDNEMKLLEKNVELISSKWLIDTAMPPPITITTTITKRPFCSTFFTKRLISSKRLCNAPFWGYLYPFCSTFFTKRHISSKRQCNAPFWGYLYPFCSNTNVELFVNIFVNNFVNKPPLRPWQ